MQRLRVLFSRIGSLDLRQAVTDAAEVQAGRLVLWLPFALGAGCAAYLSLRFERLWLWVLGLIALTGRLYVLAQRLEWRLVIRKCLLLALIFAFGIGLCKLRTERVAAPVLSSEQTQFRMDAVVIDIICTDTSEPKLLLAPLRISDVAPEDTPIRLV